jgi:hypothetical protein
MTRTLISAFSNRGYTISINELANGLQDFGVILEDSNVKKLFKYLDRGDSGKVDLADLLDELRGQEISFERFEMIRKAYSKLDDANKNSPPNSVSLDDIARAYDVSENPDVTSGRLTSE